jgi:hypothetical protein
VTDTLTIPRSRFAALQDKTLDSGQHEPNGTYCVMEAVAWMAGEAWTDHPVCVSPVVAAFARNWNDSLGEADRNRLLKPLLLDMVGTATTPEDEETRAWMATDWLARVHAPAWLRLAGLTKEAQALEGCARIVDAVTAGAAQPRLEEARHASVAAWAAASAAAWDAARDAASAAASAAAWDAASAAARDAASAAAWDAARDAAWAAASAAAWDAAWDAASAAASVAAWAAASAAAWDAARDAARDALRPTVEALQESAVELLREMCAVGRVPVVVDETA